MLVGAVALAAGATLVACAGLDKREVERRLLALQKNAALGALGLERKSARIEIEGEQRDVEFSWVHVPARPGVSAPPLVFVHGTPSTLFNWSGLVTHADATAALAGDCDVYLLEVAGHGQCRTELPRYTFQACADWVRGFLVALDLREVTLVGQSYGGEFAWRAALDAPERVAKLVLIDSSGWRRADDGWLSEEVALREWPGARWGYLFNSRERLGPALQLHFREPIGADQLEEMYTCCDNADNWRAMTELCRDENGVREQDIAKLRQPTLLVWGDRDLAYPAQTVGARFASAIAGSRLVVVPDAGHYPHEERADEVRRALREFHFAR